MALAQFQVVFDPPKASIVVNGVDVSNHVTGLYLAADASARIPVLTLQMTGGGEISGEGIVQVEAAFLTDIDPEELDTAITAELQTADGNETVGELAVRALRKMASGD